ncbi:MAG TPA: tetratricopeptide repeat protein, partial [Campylobacterales bacterium]|nr:tetratricopeptide repeat protein [Campylobacterales bacterium]
MKKTVYILLLSFLLTACSAIGSKTEVEKKNFSAMEKKMLLQKANKYNNEGVKAYRKGDLKASVAYYKKSIKIKERVLGVDNLNTATSYNNLGLVYKRMGKHNEALVYISEALKIRERQLGRIDSQTAQSYNNLGTL